MSQPLWKELTKQSALEEQYDILKGRGTFSDQEIAIHLARFAEAHIFCAAERHVADVEARMAAIKQAMKEMTA